MADNDRYFNKKAVAEITDKDHALSVFMRNILNKTNNIFEYTGLPTTLNARFLELYLQLYGECLVTEVEGNLYAFFGGWGGECDAYYQPKKFIVANPWLDFNKECEIGKDGVLCRNDSLTLGLDEIIRKYGVLIIENLISFRIAAINTRIQTIIDASDDAAYESAKQYLKDIEAGKLAAISADDLFEKIHVNPASSHDRCIVDLIELNQYLLSQMYSEIGISDNYNMKRERLTSGEVEMMKDKPAISLENMYKERCIFCDAINEMYGTNIKVRINERWSPDEDTEGSIPGFDERFVHSHGYEDTRSSVADGDDTEES